MQQPRATSVEAPAPVAGCSVTSDDAPGGTVRPRCSDDGATPVERDGWDRVIVLLLVVTVWGALWVPQLRHPYPFTYDELIYAQKTRAYDRWLRTGLTLALRGQPLWLFSPEALQQAEFVEDMHPGLVKLAGVLPERLVRALTGREGGHRLTGGLFLALTMGLLYWFLRPRIGRTGALLAAAGLATFPRVFAHAHFHALDIPAMAMNLLAALAFYRAAGQDRWGPALVSGVCIGLAMATKLNAITLVPHLGAWLLIAAPPGRWKALAGSLVAPLVFVALWPWLWPDLGDRLAQYWAYHHRHFYVWVSYLGHVYGCHTTAPVSYPLVMMAFTTPVTWVVAIGAGLVGCYRRRLPPSADFMALGLIANVGLLMVPFAARYGGVRLLLPAFPFAVALGGFAVHRLVGALAASQPVRARSVWAACALALLVPGIVGCVRTYPYCLSYYSGLVGLPGAARMGMDVTYWGDALCGAEEFMARPDNADKVFYTYDWLGASVLDALVTAGRVPPQHHMAGRFVKGELPPDADWIIVDNCPPLWPPAIARLVHTRRPVVTVSRCAVPLMWVFPGPRQDPTLLNPAPAAAEVPHRRPPPVRDRGSLGDQTPGRE